MTAVDDEVAERGFRSFVYRSRSAYWWRYLPVGAGLIFIYVVVVFSGLQPFSGIAFPFLVALVLFDITVTAFLRIKGPRAFHADTEQLKIQWSIHEDSVPLGNVFVRKGLSKLLTSGTVIRAGGKTIAVFEDLDGYSDFVAMFSAGITPSDEEDCVQ